MADPEVLLRVEGTLGRITLNRPKALNALTRGMVREIDAALTAWESDPAVAAILIDGAGERGLCAGGDIRMIYDTAMAGDLDPSLTFWQEEYPVNARLSRFGKPIVAWMSGLVMGGGVGISAHNRHRVVTESTGLAMPEVSIGFVPDVGGTFLLSRAPGELGTHAALTGGRFGPADVIVLGLADLHIPTARFDELVAGLRDCPDDTVGDLLASLATAPAPAPGQLAEARDWIDAVYAFDTVEAILAAMDRRPEPAAGRAAEQLRRHSPTSLKVTLRALREARRLPDLEACLVAEFRIAAACIAGHDMREGIRAAVVDKDRNPRWSPARLEEATAAIVDRHFADVPYRTLAFSPSRRQPQ